MKVQFCEFPDDLYYDVENNTWLRKSSSHEVVIGITSILSTLAGRIKIIRLRKEVSYVKREQLVATVESSRFFGAIPSPVEGRIVEFNPKVEELPRLANDQPYSEGWIAKIGISHVSQQLSVFPFGKEALEKLNARINELKIRCFKKIPDEELIAVGSECAPTLVDLGELLKTRPAGTVVHVLSDDPLAGIEMVRWADLTKNVLVESRDEGDLHHFLIEKKGS